MMRSTQLLPAQPARVGRWLAALALLLGLSALTANASITLSRFDATPQADGSILVVWETATEFDTQGFNLYRATDGGGPWGQPVDTQEAEGDGFTGATYQYRDTDVLPGVTYYYLLEELTSAGPGDVAGPISGLVPAPTATPTATSTATPTVTRTATATQDTGGSTQAPPTATRRFTNTPAPPPSVPAGPGPTQMPAPLPPATFLPGAQVATPTPGGGLIVVPTTAFPVLTQASPATAAPAVEPTPTASDRPGPAPTGIAATASPQVFAQATASTTLADAPARVTPQPASPVRAGRDIPLMLLLGGGAIAAAGILGAASLLIWRASRSQ